MQQQLDNQCLDISRKLKLKIKHKKVKSELDFTNKVQPRFHIQKPLVIQTLQQQNIEVKASVDSIAQTVKNYKLMEQNKQIGSHQHLLSKEYVAIPNNYNYNHSLIKPLFINTKQGTQSVLQQNPQSMALFGIKTTTSEDRKIIKQLNQNFFKIFLNSGGKNSTNMLSQTTNPSSLATPSTKNASIINQKYVGEEYLKSKMTMDRPRPVTNLGQNFQTGHTASLGSISSSHFQSPKLSYNQHPLDNQRSEYYQRNLANKELQKNRLKIKAIIDKSQSRNSSIKKDDTQSSLSTSQINNGNQEQKYNNQRVARKIIAVNAQSKELGLIRSRKSRGPSKGSQSLTKVLSSELLKQINDNSPMNNAPKRKTQKNVSQIELPNIPIKVSQDIDDWQIRERASSSLLMVKGSLNSNGLDTSMDQISTPMMGFSPDMNTKHLQPLAGDVSFRNLRADKNNCKVELIQLQQRITERLNNYQEENHQLKQFIKTILEENRNLKQRLMEKDEPNFDEYCYDEEQLLQYEKHKQSLLIQDQQSQ
ncbi:UNKNOWN [Stylonychia lemnae]|uniref:Uncharacterized protein n=1 Tax=Stylonychia lemnae TaxID=5949 RepID=A0A078BAR8_STYLE|nr:UNKNOWN [Stylonychia lemnae]|eukprot:CDW91660.1 UNKNOWN [Stylonychia lemnae]